MPGEISARRCFHFSPLRKNGLLDIRKSVFSSIYLDMALSWKFLKFDTKTRWASSGLSTRSWGTRPLKMPTASYLFLYFLKIINQNNTKFCVWVLVLPTHRCRSDRRSHFASSRTCWDSCRWRSWAWVPALVAFASSWNSRPWRDIEDRPQWGPGPG